MTKLDERIDDALQGITTRLVAGSTLVSMEIGLLNAVRDIAGRHTPKTLVIRCLCPQHASGMRHVPEPDYRAIVDACEDCEKRPVVSCTACDPICPDTNIWPCEDIKIIMKHLGIADA